MDEAEYRRLMGCWATGVSIVTAQGADGPSGATANAFSSLSLDPPLALVCFDLSSRTLHAVRESELFCINILSASQEDVSRLFATKADQASKFSAIAYRVEHGVPVIDGALAYLACSLDSELRRGDHVVAVGEVIAGAVDDAAEPLLYYRSSYAGVSGPERPSPSGVGSGADG